MNPCRRQFRGLEGLLTFVFMICSPLLAVEQGRTNANAEPHPVIVLYEQRREMEANELERQKTNFTYTAEMKNRLEPLFSSGALPEATIQAVRAEYDLAHLRVKSQESRVSMAQAMLDIAKYRLGKGNDMPFCSLPQLKELNDADWELPGLLKGGR